MPAGDVSNRVELARFLRSRRERVSPVSVGLPVGPRRRTRGLRREEVAVLAGLSTSWYTYLEQGRQVSPSPSVLDSLARVLQMSEDERRYLHVLARGEIERPAPLATADAGATLLSDALALVMDSPYPAYVGDRRGDLLAWNHAAVDWYDDFGALPVEERNIIWWMLLAPRAKVRLADWETDTMDAVARWRAEAARHPADIRTRELITELSGLSPEFRRWWASQDVQEHRSRIRRFHHPELGLRTMRIVPFFTPEAPGAAVILHLPVDS